MEFIFLTLSSRARARARRGRGRVSNSYPTAHHAAPTTIQHVRINHRGAHILMSEQLLHGANAVVLEAGKVANLIRKMRRTTCEHRDTFLGWPVRNDTIDAIDP